jgi:hypothetical protein
MNRLFRFTLAAMQRYAFNNVRSKTIKKNLLDGLSNWVGANEMDFSEIRTPPEHKLVRSNSYYTYTQPLFPFPFLLHRGGLQSFFLCFRKEITNPMTVLSYVREGRVSNRRLFRRFLTQ